MPNILEIHDLAAPELAPYAQLTGAQLRSRQQPERALLIAESAKVIGHALDAGCEPVSLLMEKRHISGQGAPLIARCGEIPVYTGESALLERLTGFALTRGILCAMKRPRLPAAAELLRSARRVAVLEDIVDPTNVGAIFRSAAALGVDAVLASPRCCDPLHRRAVRVSMGTVFQIPWARLDGWPEPGMEQLRACGFKTAAMALRADSIGIDDAALASEERLAIILGAEGDGLASATIAACDYTVCIPMTHGVDSLNVAAASAVAFWALCRREGNA